MRWVCFSLLSLALLGLMALLLGVAPPVHAGSLCPGGEAHRAYLAGVLAMTQQAYATAVTHFARAVQCDPTQPVYAQMLTVARQKLLQGSRKEKLA